MASSGTGDDEIPSSALLITSMLYQRRQENVRKRKRNSQTCENFTKNRCGFYPENYLRDSENVRKLAELLRNKDAQQTCSTLLLV